MRKLLCKIGIHYWNYKDMWLPSVTDKNVAHYINWEECRVCGKRYKYSEIDWDTTTRQPVNRKV